MPEQVPETVTIARLGAQGDGMAQSGGRGLLVSFVLPGERVSVRATGKRGGVALAEVIEVIEPSSERVTPQCGHFGVCGGCAMQHASPQLVADWRRSTIVEALTRARVDAPVAPAIRVAGAGRRRTRWAAIRLRGGRVLLGYHQRRSDRIVDINTCPQIAEPLAELVGPLRAALAAVLGNNETADVAANLVDNGIDLLLIGPRDLSLDARMALTELAERYDLARVSWQPADREPPEPVALLRMPVAMIGGMTVEIPPDAFRQPTAKGEAAMVGFASEALAGAKHVADLFAGCGTFTLPLSDKMRITAYESAAPMVGALDAAARTAQLTGRVTVIARDLDRRPLQRDEVKRFDGMILDPPRSGASRQCDVLSSHGPAVLVMASCNPASFSRDARTLIDGGYRLSAVQPVDQFGWSHHVELISRFDRR